MCVSRWIPGELEFLRASNLSETFEPDSESFDADGRLPCKIDDWESMVVDGDMAVLDDGRLIMFGDDDRSTGIYQRLTFSNAEYCIDRVMLFDNVMLTRDVGYKNITRHNLNATAAVTVGAAANATDVMPMYAYVALVCRPCSRITCVPKCCGKGFVLEYRNNRGGITGCRRVADNANAVIHLKAANGTELQREYYVSRAFVKRYFKII